MKTIFITSFNMFTSRNILSSGVVPELLFAGDIRIVVLAHDYKKAYFEKTLARSGILVEGVETGVRIRTFRVGVFKRLAEATPNTKRAAFGRRRTFSGGKKSPFVRYLFYIPASFLGRFIFFIRLFRLLDFYISPRGRFYELLGRYRPDIVFSTDIQNEHDVALMQDARRKGIKIVGMVRSWDTLTTRSLRIVPDLVLTHNNIIKGEAVCIHGILPNKVKVVGIPQYDTYLKGPTMSREAFFRKMKFDPRKKLIVYAPICDHRLRENIVDRYVLDILAFRGENICVHFPPVGKVSISGFSKPSHMTFLYPNFVSFNQNVAGVPEMIPEDDERLKNLLKWCDLVIAGPSTFILDAAVFDKPIILVDFYPREVSYYNRIFEYEVEHIAPILASGGVRITKSKKEFLENIDAYLAHPERDGQGRKAIVEEQCWSTDGQSSKRIAQALLKALGTD